MPQRTSWIPLQRIFDRLTAEAKLDQALEEIHRWRQGASEVVDIYYSYTREASVLAVKGNFEQAQDILTNIRDEVSQLNYRPLLAAFWMASADLAVRQSEWRLVINLIEPAIEVYTEEQMAWHSSAARINKAISLASLDSIREAFEELEIASNLLNECTDIDPDLIAYRRAAIAINKANFLSAHPEVSPGSGLNSATDVFLEAHRTLNELPYPHLIGIVEFNLAVIYQQRELYGSALEAAQSAATRFATNPADPMYVRSLIIVGQALTNLGRHEEARLIAEPIVVALPPPGTPGTHMSYVDDALSLLSTVNWRTGNGRIADEYTRLRKEYSRRHDDTLNAILTAYNAELLNIISTGDVSDDMGSLLTRIAGSDHPLASDLAALARDLGDAITGKETAASSTPEQLSRLRAEGIDVDSAQESIKFAKAMSSSESLDLAFSCLRRLYRLASQRSMQHDEFYRSAIIEGLSSSDIETVLNILLRSGRRSVVAELAEFFRIGPTDLEESSDTPITPFRTVTNLEKGKFVHYENTTMPQWLRNPGMVSVDGLSAMADAVGARAAAFDLQDLRKAIGGAESTWWSTIINGGHIYWSLMDSSTTIAGKGLEVRDALPALSRHRAMLAIPLEQDRRIAPDAPEWLVQLVALSRCAAGPMLRDEDLLTQALECMPISLQARVREYVKPIREIDLLETYHELGRAFIPPELALRCNNSNRQLRLVVTLPPELSTIPLSLLSLEENRILGQDAVFRYAPPPSLAAALAAREPMAGLASKTIIAIDPRGDLGFSEFAPAATQLFCSWEAAAFSNQVASAARLLPALISSQHGQASVFAYIGHIRSGTRQHPGSAALLLAPEDHPAGNPTEITAHELLRRNPYSFPRRAYLGGCQGSGLETGYEWVAWSSAALRCGADVVIAHSWPIADTVQARMCDSVWLDELAHNESGSEAFDSQQAAFLTPWLAGEPHAVAPHYWAGAQHLGRTA